MKKVLYLGTLLLTGCSYFTPHLQCAGVRAKIGMLPEEVLAVCGEPKRINRSESKGYHYEQWVYERWTPRDYVYINNGKVSSMQW